jgi:hypothetical protein
MSPEDQIQMDAWKWYEEQMALIRTSEEQAAVEHFNAVLDTEAARYERKPV